MNRLIYVLTLILFSTFNGFTQIKRSNFTTGISFGALHQKDVRKFPNGGINLNKSNSFESALFFNYFFRENWSIGLNFGIKKFFSENNATNEFTSYYANKKQIHLFSFGLNPRYYIPISSNFYIPIELQANYFTGSGEEDILIPQNLNRIESNVYRGFGLFINPGISYFISKKVEINMTFSLMSFTQFKSFSTLISSNQITTNTAQLGSFGNHHETVNPFQIRFKYFLKNVKDK